MQFGLAIGSIPCAGRGWSVRLNASGTSARAVGVVMPAELPAQVEVLAVRGGERDSQLADLVVGGA